MKETSNVDQISDMIESVFQKQFINERKDRERIILTKLVKK
jgi:hypothetical protein